MIKRQTDVPQGSARTYTLAAHEVLNIISVYHESRATQLASSTRHPPICVSDTLLSTSAFLDTRSK
ncbi:hypothetical protein E2C01_054188 [Portunus trituberculatus]|uniref:Uncharacterized protein n=1 Tax=Portunus trituberculatus TaxID=210409 RepID=A0A5B7GJ81_PORTR|nr:hypothetical protein [Portunus trituberculatus]